MNKRSRNTIITITALFASCLLCAMIDCSRPRENMQSQDYGKFQWYIREVTKGEIVPVEGSHKHFDAIGPPIPIRVEKGRFKLAFSLIDGRQRQVVFLIRRENPKAIEVSCPLKNLEPNADALSRKDRRLNEAISNHAPVNVAANEWTVFFNDKLKGVFSSDWQLWWGESKPD